ncbi:MAG TPA: hypothetical protein VIV11_40730 [Kofleriaceae bacterium]
MTEFRVYADGQPATRDFSRSIEQVHVEQTMQGTWEAELHIKSCMNDLGHWSQEAVTQMDLRKRLRLELRAHGGDWVPLIEGPTVGVDLAASGEPGQSTTTIRVRDDSVYLDRGELQHTFDAGSDLAAVIRRAFKMVRGIELAAPEVSVEGTCEPEGGPQRQFTMHGSIWGFLNRLARDHGLYVRILPGVLGQPSRPVFGPLPKPDGSKFPQLVLAGPNRNIDSFRADVAVDQPGRVLASSLSIGDRTTTTHRAQLRDTELLGDDTVVDEDAEVSVLVAPGIGELVGPDCAATAVLRRRGFIIEASGTVQGRCYPGVLSPFRYVDVTGVDKRVTGTFLIRSVSHVIDRAGYTQNFSLWRNAFSSGNSTVPTGSLF